MKLDYVNLSAQWEDEKNNLRNIFDEVMSTGQYVGGKYVELFEKKVCEYTGAKYCIALNSGTDSLVTSLVASGVKKGDEVITPPNSFIASTSSIIHIGAKPVFADVLDDQSIDPEEIRKKITKKTKAIMPVHLTGKVSQMKQIMSIADEFDIPVIEDSAQSIGSTHMGVQSGRFGFIGCFSAHPLKNLNACGDAGFTITDNEDVYNSVRLMRNHGLENREKVTRFGYVSRMDNLQAAILSYRIDKLKDVIRVRQKNAEIYFKNLKNTNATLPKGTTNESLTYHTFVIQIENRDEVKKKLFEAGIETNIHYPVPIHLQPASSSLGYRLGDFPKTEEQSKKILTLPIHQYLKKDEIEYVCEQIKKLT